VLPANPRVKCPIPLRRLPVARRLWQSRVLGPHVYPPRYVRPPHARRTRSHNMGVVAKAYENRRKPVFAPAAPHRSAASVCRKGSARNVPVIRHPLFHPMHPPPPCGSCTEAPTEPRLALTPLGRAARFLISSEGCSPFQAGAARGYRPARCAFKSLEALTRSGLHLAGCRGSHGSLGHCPCSASRSGDLYWRCPIRSALSGPGFGVPIRSRQLLAAALLAAESREMPPVKLLSGAS
jgi:hypothetical protein